MKFLTDLIREYRIRSHFWAAVGAKDSQRKAEHFAKMNTLIRQRSPEPRIGNLAGGAK